MKKGLPIERLPDPLSLQIGIAVVKYSLLEHLLSSCINRLIGVTAKEGRLAVAKPSAAERFDTICDLLNLYKVQTKANTTKLRERIAKCASHRNEIVHGMWVLAEGSTDRVLLRITKGNWKRLPGQPKVRRVISPEGKEYTARDAQAFVRYLTETLHDFGDMVDEVVPLHRGARLKALDAAAQQP